MRVALKVRVRHVPTWDLRQVALGVVEPHAWAASGGGEWYVVVPVLPDKGAAFCA